MKDLVVLVADVQMKAALEGMLSRHLRLGTHPVSADIYPHQARDPGVRLQAPNFLRLFLKSHRHAMVFLDYEGCGARGTADRLRDTLQTKMDQNGWKDRSAVFVLVPELEAWVWSRSPEVANALGWVSEHKLRKWLEAQGLVEPSRTKPRDPKRAMDAALERARKSRSSSIYKAIALTVEFDLCTDPTFQDFRQTMQAWFPPR